MLNNATFLVQKLNGTFSKKIKKSTKSILLSLVSDLDKLQTKEKCKNYIDNPEHIIGCIYGNKTVLNSRSEIRAYCKCQLHLATCWLKELIRTIEKNGKGGLSYNSISNYKEHISSWVFELKPYVEYFGRKRNPDYEFIWGVKPNYRQAWQIFGEANKLYWSSSQKKDTVDHVISVNLSAFTLRQSLEIKFQRILGVSRIYDSSLESPKFRHEFFADFIQDNLDNISTEYNSLRGIIKIYKWTNRHIHTGIAPKTWKLEYALSYCSQLFIFSDELTPNKRWSVHDAVKISNNNIVLENLYQKVYSYHSEKLFCFEIKEPEAVICS